MALSSSFWKKQTKTKQMFNQMQIVLKINLEKFSEKNMHLLDLETAVEEELVITILCLA